MNFLDHLRSSNFAKFLTLSFAVVLLLFVALVMVSGFVLYGVLRPGPSGGQVNPRDLLGNQSTVEVSAPGISRREGIFFPGQQGAPTILLVHGYRASRSDLLNLALALQENKYNVFVFDLTGHGEARGTVGFGFGESREVMAALEAVGQRTDVDQMRFGVFGVDIGGYAALADAANEKRIKAVAVESVYNRPVEMFDLQVQREGLSALPLVKTFCRWTFHVMHFGNRNDPPLADRVRAMKEVPKLFLLARDTPALYASTLGIFQAAGEPRQQELVAKSAANMMSEEERRNYETLVVQFFLQNLPPIPQTD